MWPSACWREGIGPSIPPFLNFGGGTARISGRCWWRWCSWRGTLGLVALATLVPDSTKVRANAGKRKAMSIGRMQQGEARLTAEIEALQRQAEALDTAEDAQFGMDLRGDEVPAVLQPREGCRTAVRPEPQSKYNFADPESRIMPTSQDGFQHCYNAQLVVDADSQLIVAAAVSPGQRPGPVAGVAGGRAGRIWPYTHQGWARG